MRYYSEEIVKQIMSEVEVKEIQCNIYDNIYTVHRIYPNLEDYSSIDIPEPRGRCIDADKLNCKTLRDYMGNGHKVILFEDIQNAPTILEASK